MNRVFLLSLSLAWAVHAQPPAARPEPAKPAISGGVTDATTGLPLRKAYLSLSRSRATTGARDGELPIVVSDDEGHFTFTNLDPGIYAISVEKPGYVSTDVQDLHVGADQGIANLRIRLTRLATVTVHILDPDGDRVPFGTVNFYRLTFRNGKRRLQRMDAVNGDETVRLEPGRYYIAASIESSAGRRMPVQYITTWYPNTPDAATAAPVWLAPGQNIDDLEIRLRPGTTYKIRGVVAGLPPPEKGAPPHTVFARLQSGLAEDPNWPASSVDAKGRFELSGLAPGDYLIEVGRRNWSRGGEITSFGTTAAQIANEDLVDLTLELTPPRTVALHISTDRGSAIDFSDLTFGLIASERYYPLRPRENAAGTYEAHGIGPGQSCSLQIWSRSGQDVYVKTVSVGGAVLPDRVLNVDRAGAEPVEVVLSTHGGAVTGTVTVDGADAKGDGGQVTVLLLPDSASPERREREGKETKSDSIGAFGFRSIPPGKYELYAWRDLPDGAWKDPDFWKEMRSEATRVAIVEDGRQQIQVPLISPDRTRSLLERLDIR